MKSTVKNHIRIRIDDNLLNRINSFLVNNPKISISDLFREAVMWYMTKDLEDHELMAVNIKTLVKQIENQKDTLLLLTELLTHFIRVWMVYVHDIPNELRTGAWQAGQVRFDKFMDGFKVKLKKDTNVIEKLLMLFLENGGDQPGKKQE